MDKFSSSEIITLILCPLNVEGPFAPKVMNHDTYDFEIISPYSHATRVNTMVKLFAPTPSTTCCKIRRVATSPNPQPHGLGLSPKTSYQ